MDSKILKALLLFISLCWLFIACSNQDHQDDKLPNTFNKQDDTSYFKLRPAHPGWKEIKFSNWSFLVPQTFNWKSLQGIDSQPGLIESDSIHLEYDTDYQPRLNRKRGDVKCDLTDLVNEAKESLKSRSLYMENAIVEHKAVIDTLYNSVAIIVAPIKAGTGEIHMSVTDCVSGNGIFIYGRGLNAAQQQLALEIFRTLVIVKKPD
jgi:hypothetical protein